MMNIKLNKYLTRACIRNLNLWVQTCYSNDLKMGAGRGGTEVSMAALVGIIGSCHIFVTATT